MTIDSLSRRRCLAGLAAGALAAVMPPRAARASGVQLRIGAVLPLGGPQLSTGAGNLSIVAEAARTGLVLSEEDLSRNAGLLGHSVHVSFANAPGPGAASRAARRLVTRDRVDALIGGFTTEEAVALSTVAEATATPFFNIGAIGDGLRSAACRPFTFHVAASAAMYLDAIADWYVRAGHRRWYVVHSGGREGQAWLARARQAIEDRHWGARISGEREVGTGERGFADVVDAVVRDEPDVVLVLTDWLAQLDFLAQFDATGAAIPVTGLPEPAAQTRHFYALARQSAPTAGLGHRVACWEATLDAYGARELNSRYAARWGRPMDPAAWAAYQALRLLFETAQRSGSTEGRVVAEALIGDEVVFDVHKGIGVGFRPWDHQLRQSLYLVRVNAVAGGNEPGDSVEAVAARATLVGELPAIYMPGTEPVQRLDQLGDMEVTNACG